MRFDGKRVFVVGAGSGIGRATALLFADDGARVDAELPQASGWLAIVGGHNDLLLTISAEVFE
ncbi:hypothetical protein [Caballeronia sordidicola]|uniref:Uncharacterized protein n=1 Tax=Caballeronia sordidicola TaxID=196367 RepID=A0A242N5S0_CABSO|nr:hypothetical protein PAMC26577_02485 [Caballeronia sordidicola]